MDKRSIVALAALAVGLIGLVGGPSPAADDKAKAPAADDKVKAPRTAYGYDLRVRPGGKKNFDAKTPKLGVEFYTDEANGLLYALSETGALAVVSGVTPTAEKKDPVQVTAHDLRARKAGEAEFSQGTKLYGVEAFKDLRANRLLYICETGSVAFAPLPGTLTGEKGPKWHHALEPKVRMPDETTFAEAKKKFGIEAFVDENTGGLIYVTEIGAIAAAPAPAATAEKGKVKAPVALHGLNLQVRKVDEPNFTEATRHVGIEVMEDPNSNTLFYLSDAGWIATAPKPAKMGETRGVLWKGAMNLRVRKGGDKSFEKSNRYGIEVFLDNRTGYLVYLCETGSIAVLAK